MNLKVERLDNVKVRVGKIIAACPACRAEGGDRAGDHLVIFDDGRFGCVRYSGRSWDSITHRKTICRLVGDGNAPVTADVAPEAFLKLPGLPQSQPIIVARRLGRVT
jgi:hypothetical protein